MIETIEREGSVLVTVHVVPRARRDAVEGEYQGALKVCLTAPPVDNKANVELCRLLAERLNIPRSAVRIASGEKSRTKRVAIQGVDAAQIQALISVKQK